MDGSAEMSKRTHFWLRVAALVIIAAAAWLPRGSEANGGSAAKVAPADSQIQASVAR